MRTSLCLLTVLLLFSGCKNEYQYGLQSDETVAHSAILPRPIVTFMPIVSRAKHHLPWDIASSLTLSVHHALAKKDRLYLIDQERAAKASKELQTNQDPFGDDISWVKKKFKTEEFVAFVELAEHQETPLNFQNDLPVSECPAELYMSARLKIFDLRGAAPKVILSETLSHSENIPKQFTRANLALPLLPDQEGFETTPQGIAHDLFAREIASRIEDYILMQEL